MTEYSYKIKIESDRYDVEIDVIGESPKAYPANAYIQGHKDGFKAGFERGYAEAEDDFHLFCGI